MRTDFNSDWLFWSESEESMRTLVELPHDAMLYEKRRPDTPGQSASAFFPGNRYCYEKEFHVPEEWLHKHITLEFEGVYKNAQIFVNGEKIYQAAYGYSEFFVVLDEYIREGENQILVRTDNSGQPDSRWYSGAGIYRPVWLYVQEKQYIRLQGGIRISTVSITPPEISVSVEIQDALQEESQVYLQEDKRKSLNDNTGRHQGLSCMVEILDDNGKMITSKKLENVADSAETVIQIPGAELWSEQIPCLYSAVIKLFLGETLLESRTEQFGIRMISWTPDGFFVNGQSVLLRGGCIHHDHGILGAAAYDKSEERRIRILKENGYNAIRCAHNPCSRAMLEACDKYGVYVMDELWDMWYQHKSKYDYASEFMEHYKEDIESMIKRDFNHPSVIMYSIGNEVSEPAHKKGVELAERMKKQIKELDATRAVVGGMNLMIISNAAKGKDMYNEDGGRDDSSEKKMAGMNSTMFNMITSMVGSGMNRAANGKAADKATAPVLAQLDISGYNYASGRYKMDGKLHPDRIIMGSETFPQDIGKNWEMVKKYPYLIGDFMWTAWDYIGEAGIGAWAYHEDAKGFSKPYPWLLADTGAFDILGNPNGEAMLAKAVWGIEQKPQIGVRPVNHPDKKPIKASWRGTNALPSWSWEGCDGNKAIVEVFSMAAKVELILNGKPIGKKKTKLGKALFHVRYVPGILKAIAYDGNGKKLSEGSLESAAGSSHIKLKAEEEQIKAGGIDYIDISVVGDNGIVRSNADEKLTISVENGELLGFGSANPRTEERFTENQYTTYYGKAQAVIKGKKMGQICVRVRGEKIPESKVVIEVM